MTTPPAIKILITLPITLRQYLEDLKRLEGVTVSGYIRQLVEMDRRGRLETGWNPDTGWKQIDDPAYQRRMRAAKQRAGEQVERLIVTRAREIQKRQAGPSPTRRPARPKKTGGTP
jgi:hypothetical protein